MKDYIVKRSGKGKAFYWTIETMRNSTSSVNVATRLTLEEATRRAAMFKFGEVVKVK